ncbi:MAG TPA: hypothetical protein VGW57_15545 [Chthoniobacterales bacterium]|nr:hypothetical protein [Chthoniobacterales bacterium]
MAFQLQFIGAGALERLTRIATGSPAVGKMTTQDDTVKVAPQTNGSVNAERKHLEGLLKDCFNFNLVFTSVFLAGLSHLEEPIRLVTLIVGTTISLLISLAICRTRLLVGKVLDDLKQSEPDLPYVKYSKQIGLPSANIFSLRSLSY